MSVVTHGQEAMMENLKRLFTRPGMLEESLNEVLMSEGDRVGDEAVFYPVRENGLDPGEWAKAVRIDENRSRR